MNKLYKQKIKLYDKKSIPESEYSFKYFSPSNEKLEDLYI